MMPQSRTGPSNRPVTTSDARGVTNVYPGATRASWRSGARGLGKLRIVEVDRRSRDRLDMDSYGPFFAKERSAYPIFKRAFDLVGASVAILLLSPLVLVIVICIFASGGSPFFRHRRVGQSGIFFDCIKFRTMVTDSDDVLKNLLESDSGIKEEWLRDHKLKDDPRVTSIGRFLRKASLDELPQLWNVLRGDMSLVGPRPVVPCELPRYGRKVALFLSTRPGITGLWQISGRNNTDYRRRVALDVCYVRSRSVILDVYILLKTLPAVFTTSGAY
jgi:lipopolysaccharide/colanic/teichoic acid biosynthesis glycosyltransferase